MTVIIGDNAKKKMSLLDIFKTAFVANPFSFIYMLVGQIIALVVIKYPWIVKLFYGKDNKTLGLSIGLTLFALIVWKLFVLYLRKEKDRKIIKISNMIVEYLTGINWVIDTLGDFVFGAWGCLSIYAIKLLGLI